MGDPKTLVERRRRAAGATALLLAWICALCGCAAVRVALRHPGEHNKTMPEEVAQEYHCDKRGLPFFEIEKSQLLPARVKPGKQLSHRIVYVMCPRRPTEVVAGTLDTIILFKGKIIFEEVVEQEIKPGRWVVDTFIPLPAEAEPGVYALQLEFRSKHGNLDQRSDFIVKPDKK